MLDGKEIHRETEKRIDLSHLSQPTEIITENLGKLRLRPIGAGMALKLFPSVESIEALPPEDVAQKVMLAFAETSPETADQGGFSLTPEQEALVTARDVREFAYVFCEHEGWGTHGRGVNDRMEHPENVLAQGLVSLIKEITESAEKIGKHLRFPFMTDAAKRIFEENSIITNRIKDWAHDGGFLVNLYGRDDLTKPSLQAEAFLDLHETLRKNQPHHFDEFPSVLNSRYGPGGAPARNPAYETLREFPSPTKILGEKSDEVKKAINSTAERIIDGVKLTAAAVVSGNEKTNELVLSFEEQRQSGERSQRITVFIAVVALFVSIATGSIGVWVSWKSYEHNLKMEEDSAKEQLNIVHKEELKMQILRDQLSASQEQNLLLRQLIEHATVTPQKK